MRNLTGQNITVKIGNKVQKQQKNGCEIEKNTFLFFLFVFLKLPVF